MTVLDARLSAFDIYGSAGGFAPFRIADVPDALGSLSLWVGGTVADVDSFTSATEYEATTDGADVTWSIPVGFEAQAIRLTSDGTPVAVGTLRPWTRGTTAPTGATTITINEHTLELTVNGGTSGLGPALYAPGDHETLAVVTATGGKPSHRLVMFGTTTGAGAHGAVHLPHPSDVDEGTLIFVTYEAGALPGPIFFTESTQYPAVLGFDPAATTTNFAKDWTADPGTFVWTINGVDLDPVVIDEDYTSDPGTATGLLFAALVSAVDVTGDPFVTVVGSSLGGDDYDDVIGDRTITAGMVMNIAHPGFTLSLTQPDDDPFVGTITPYGEGDPVTVVGAADRVAGGLDAIDFVDGTVEGAGCGTHWVPNWRPDSAKGGWLVAVHATDRNLAKWSGSRPVRISELDHELSPGSMDLLDNQDATSAGQALKEALTRIRALEAAITP